MHVVDTLDFLLGRWSVVRTVTDHRAGLEARFEGWADVREETDHATARRANGRPVDPVSAGEARHASYEEVGRLLLAGYDGAAQRRLSYRRRPDASLLVELPSGGFFVNIDLRAGNWWARHDCGADRYDLTFLVRSPEAFEEHWRVRGPSKDYKARAVFLRDRRSSGPPDLRTSGPPGPDGAGWYLTEP